MPGELRAPGATAFVLIRVLLAPDCWCSFGCMKLCMAGLALGLAMGAAAQTAPVRLSSGVAAAQCVRCPTPKFPEEARRAHVSGSVVLHVLIGEDGTVREATVVSGPQMLRQPWLDAVRQRVYRPYLLNGRPVPVDTTVTMSIAMGGDPPLPAGRVHLSSGEMAGRLISKVEPVFPPGAAYDQHASGAVVLHAVIGRDGYVKELTAISGPEFERGPVMDAVRQWTYRPYVKDGEVMEVDTTIVMNIDFGG